MDSDFTEKLKDYSRWCNAAYTQHHESHFNEALMNMRKAAEAFCKLVLYFLYPRQYASASASGKSLKELIALLKNERIVPAQIINSLEALQIHGNMAAHDNIIVSEQSVHSLSSLKLITRWLFVSLLKTPVQSDFKELLGSAIVQDKKNKEKDKNKKDELESLKAERTELEKQIKFLHENRQHETERFDLLSDQLKKSTEQIEKINKSLAEKEEHTLKAESKKEIPVAAVETAPPVPETGMKKIIITLLAVLIASAGIWLVVKNMKLPKKMLHEQEALKAPADSLDAVILPFSVLQDNPNLNIKIENVLINNLSEGIRYYNLPIRLFLDTAFHNGAITFNQMISYSAVNKKSLVITGDLYEQTLADSNSVNLKVVLNNGRSITPGQIEKLKFIQLTDSNGVKIISHCFYYLCITVADHYMNTKRVSHALGLLYQTKGWNQGETGMITQLITQCHIALGNYDAAEKEALKFIKLYPDYWQGYALLGNIYFQMKRYRDSEINYKKSLTIKPDSPEMLITLAAIYMNLEKPDLEKSRHYISQAFSYDSTYAKTWVILAQEEEMENKYDLALSHYQKSILLDSAYIDARKAMVKIYADKKNDYDQAFVQLKLILKQDSTDAWALRQMANIYTLSGNNDPVKAGYYVMRAQSYEPDTSLLYKFNIAEQAYYSGDFAKALPLFLENYKSDSTNFHVSDRIIDIYMRQKKFDLAKQYLDRSLALDSFSSMANYNAGAFYALSDPPYNDELKAAGYFERDLLINPYDTLALTKLLFHYFNTGKLNDLKRICRMIISFKPEDYKANKLLSVTYSRQQNVDSALYFFRKSYSLNPNDGDLCSLYAIFIIDHDLTKKEDAMMLAKRGVQLEPQYADSHIALARVSLYFRIYDIAATEYSKAVSMNPNFKSDDFEKKLNNRTFQ